MNIYDIFSLYTESTLQPIGTKMFYIKNVNKLKVPPNSKELDDDGLKGCQLNRWKWGMWHVHIKSDPFY